MNVAARVLIGVGLVAASATSVCRAEDKDPKALAQSLLDEGAKEFARKNARVMARFYSEDAEARLVTRESDGKTKTESYRGRAEIEELYGKVFNTEEKYYPKNTVEQARFLGDGLLVVTGTFHPDSNKDLKLEFVQVREKTGKDWLIRDMQVFLVSPAR